MLLFYVVFWAVSAGIRLTGGGCSDGICLAGLCYLSVTKTYLLRIRCLQFQNSLYTLRYKRNEDFLRQKGPDFVAEWNHGV